MFDWEQYSKRMEWFNEARFGMFIHWGLYAIPAKGEWLRSQERITLEDYQVYFDEFNPTEFNPKKWAVTAKSAGMKYAVLTAKHHDGFCLFDTKLTDYKSTNTKVGKDFVREFIDAFRAEGIKVGLYYSLLDWHHEDYPQESDSFHPMRTNKDYEDSNRDFKRYVEYMHGQVKELCTNYGQLDIMWFDFSYDHMKGDTWRAKELVEMIRSYQPQVILDNRLEVSGSGFGSLVTAEPSSYSGDFISPEQIIPPLGLKGFDGRDISWESCITMNQNWGYASKDKEFKTSEFLIKKLVECVSKGGNLLLNVGPNAKGVIPEESVKILEEIGQWMAKNSESIYGCTYSNIPKPENGRITQKGDNLYYHIFENSIGAVPLHGISTKQVKKIRLLADGSERKVADNWIVNNYPDIVFAEVSDTTILPDMVDTVIKVELVDNK